MTDDAAPPPPPKLSWTRLVPAPDPVHGSPCARSSLGLSVLRNNGEMRLILYGGENVARTPLEATQACWAVDGGGSGGGLLGGDNRKEEGGPSSLPRWRRIDCGSDNNKNIGPPVRVAHAQAVSDDHQVFIFGGRAGIAMNEAAMSDLWCLDCSGEPGTERWNPVEQKGEIPEPRSFHRMVCVKDSLFVFGGCGATSGRLNDLFRFDLATNTWHELGAAKLRGRGGPNLLPLSSGARLGVIAGFAGEETSDGQRYDLEAGAWETSLMGTELEGLRPRSVCVSGSFPSHGLSIIFGGEVDPSLIGHEGAGGFANDIVLLDEKTGALKETIQPRKDEPWPEERGWSHGDGVTLGEGPNATGHLFVFGGLCGDDKNRRRLDDLWRLDIVS